MDFVRLQVWLRNPVNLFIAAVAVFLAVVVMCRCFGNPFREGFYGVQLSTDANSARVPSVLQVHTPNTRTNVKMSTLSMPQNCVRNLHTVDYRNYNADKHNIPNYHPLIGYDTRNVIHDSCLPNEDRGDFGGDCNLTGKEKFSKVRRKREHLKKKTSKGSMSLCDPKLSSSWIGGQSCTRIADDVYVHNTLANAGSLVQATSGKPI